MASATRRPSFAIAVLALTSPLGVGAQERITLHFQASAGEFEDATAEYEAIWSAEGPRIAEALERISGMTFAVAAVEVTVMEGPSWAGSDRMGMRASYPPDTKRATLAHELGHILIGETIPEDDRGEPVEDHHRVLFLFLYDVWVELWGREFADEQVGVESRRRGIVDYEGIWRETLRRDAPARARELSRLLAAWRS